MRTYLLDTLKRIKRFDESLDIKTVLCNKPWVAFDEDGAKHVYIFKEDGGLIISSLGKGRESSWEYLTANKTVKFREDNLIELYHPTFFDGNILVLNLDGTDEYALLLNENDVFKPKSINDILVRIKELEAHTKPEQKPIPTSSIPTIKPSTDNRKTIVFAGKSFFPAEKDGNLFYVNEEQRYAFSSIEHVFENAILVKNEKDEYLFFFNDSFDNVYKTTVKPVWKEYWDGLVLDAVVLNDKYLLHNGMWSKCFYAGKGYYRIEITDQVKEYFIIDDEHISFCTEEEFDHIIDQIKKSEKEEADQAFIIGGIIVLGCILFVVIIICLSGSI